MKFYVMKYTRDAYGMRINVRHTMRSYTLDAAKRIADTIRGGYVCPLGKVDPVYVGAWR